MAHSIINLLETLLKKAYPSNYFNAVNIYFVDINHLYTIIEFPKRNI